MVKHMDRESSDLVKALKIWLGGITLFTAGLVGYAITRGINSLKRYRRGFDPDTVEEVEGEIIEVYYSKESRHDTRGVILFLADEEDVYEVHLGPSWYIDRQFRHFRVGDELSVTGSRVDYKSQEIIVAQSVEIGSKKYRLRNEEGAPYWDSRIA